MSWEMATARLVISSREQILWVIARVQEGKTLQGYQIVAILCLEKKGRGNISGEKEKQRNKEADDFVGCQMCHHFNSADMDILRTEKGWTKCIQILKVLRKSEKLIAILLIRVFSFGLKNLLINCTFFFSYRIYVHQECLSITDPKMT